MCSIRAKGIPSGPAELLEHLERANCSSDIEKFLLYESCELCEKVNSLDSLAVLWASKNGSVIFVA
jgi:hypothetical protein